MEAEQFASDEVIARGEQVFMDSWAICHGQGGAARATFPGLRRSPLLVNQDAFDAGVLEGVRSGLQRPSRSDPSPRVAA